VRDPIVAALDAELTGAVVGRSEFAIDGFGLFKTRTYQAYDGRDPFDGAVIPMPERRITAFYPAAPLHERIANRTNDRLAIACPDIVERVVTRTGASAAAVTAALEAWIDDLLARLPDHSLGLPLGAIGLFWVAHRPETQGQRWMLEFSPSRCVSVRCGGGEVRGYVDADQVATVLARYPSGGVTSVAEVSRFGVTRDPSDAIRAVERHSKRPIPPLLGAILGRCSLGLIDDARIEFVAAGSRDRTPFARSEWSWWFLDHDTSGNPVVAGHTSTEPIQLAAWVTACLLVHELDALADGRVLSESDTGAVLAYLEHLSRSAALRTLLRGLPY
jgi:nucleoid DNA-binding protein